MKYFRKLVEGERLPQWGVFWSGVHYEGVYVSSIVVNLWGWSTVWRAIIFKNNAPFFWR